MPRRTPSGKKTKLASFEGQVKGTMPDHELYAIANKEGLMHGNKATAKGKKAAKDPDGDHDASPKKSVKSPERGYPHEGGGQGAIAVHPSVSGIGMFDNHHKRKF